MTSTDNPRRNEARPSIGELMATLSEKLSTLIRAEIQLAKTEMAEKAKNAGIGIGLFAAAGTLAFFGTAVLITTVILGLAEAMPAWLAALIVAVLLLGLAALLVVLGKKSLDKGTSPLPGRAQASIKADLEALRPGPAAKEGQP